ncbi:MAG TPA: TIM-barrel domain-containing protein [Solirubrobacterales bacterium]
MAIAVAFAIAPATLVFAAPPAGAVTLAARGGVAVELDATTGRIAIRGVGGGTLREAPGTGGESGRVGFFADGEWHRAAELVSHAGSTATLATDDSAGRAIEVHARVRRDGSVELAAAASGGAGTAVERMDVGFVADPRERYLGFGERSNAVDQRGHTIENHVTEGPYQPGEYDLVDGSIPDWAQTRSDSATYFPMPWLLSTRGFGLLAENRATSRFRLGTVREDEWSVEADAASLRLVVLPGPEPSDLVGQLTERTGRQPPPAAPWVLGPWFQTGHQNEAPGEREYVEILRAADAPVSVAETHMRYMPCGSDQGLEASERARTRAFHSRGLAAITYTREAICRSYAGAFDPAAASGAFIRRPDGSPYLFDSFVGGGVQEIGMLDFSNPAATEAYASILDRAVANGYDGWMEDYGEYVPPDATAANGMRGIALHNFYPVLYHSAAYDYRQAQERPLVAFIRSGWTGVHPSAEIVWGGDPTTGFGFDGLASSVNQALTMGLSGISLWASDIGGFFTLSEQRLTPELLARWIEFGAVSGVMRTKAEGIGAAMADRPQIWQEPTLPIWRRYAKLRTQLYPYLVAADRAYRRSGLPLMRHLSLAFPEDRRAVATDDEFMFGDDLLAAPVVEDGARERRVYLPGGRWVDLWRSAAFRRSDGSIRLGEAKLLSGESRRTVPAPLDELPLLARAGTILPLLAADVDTLAGYGEGKGLVHLGDRRHRLDLLAFPRGRSSARFDRHGRVRSREGTRAWTLSFEDESRRRIELQAALGSLRDPFVPRRVELDGRRLDRGRWRYDRKSGVLEADFAGRSGRLAVSG